VTTGQLDRFEPELAGAVLTLHVHMRRFIEVEAREEEPVRPRGCPGFLAFRDVLSSSSDGTCRTPRVPCGTRLDCNSPGLRVDAALTAGVTRWARSGRLGIAPNLARIWPDRRARGVVGQPDR
jgi:hypothetical protein